MSQELAERLEEYGSSRADFRELSDDERDRVANLLLIARNQSNLDGGTDRHMIMNRSQYFHTCGEVGISYGEARNIWWTFVHESPAPADRADLV